MPRRTRRALREHGKRRNENDERGATLDHETVIETWRLRVAPPAVLATLAILTALSAIPLPAMAQASGDAAPPVAYRPLATRAQLQAQLDSLAQRQATASGEEATVLERRAERIRTRLERGDFKTGDLVELRVRGDADLTDTFSVNQAGQLELGELPPVDLDGVLYSEIEPVLQEAISQFVREPDVRARPLLRIAVVGGVSNPGFYDLPPTSTLSEALMRAGGPSQQAKLDEMEFRRSGQNVLEVREEIERPVETLSLAELGAQRGDQLFVPQGGGRGTAMTVLGVVSGLAGTAWAISQVF